MAGYGRSYWADRTPAARRRSYPPIRGQHEADVVIIGGGLTGVTAASVLARSGLTVILVEARRLASGATAGGLGALIPEPGGPFRAVQAAVGLRTARAAWKASRRSALEFATALRKLRVRCDLAPRPYVINARTAADAETLRRERAARLAAGLEAPWLQAAAAAASLGTDSAGALRLREAFVLDPVRATLGLAGVAAGAGARLHEHSEVVRTKFTRKYADVLLKDGAVRTRLVYVATGEPGRLFGQLRRHVREQAGFVVATEPLSGPMKRETGPRASIVAEHGERPCTIRWLPDDRALVAGGLSAAVGARQQDKAVVVHSADLMYELSRRHPVISGLPAGSGWTVPVVSALDGLPWIGPHRNYPFHFFAMAFGWHGDALAWFAAKAALRASRDESTSEDRAFGFAR